MRRTEGHLLAGVASGIADHLRIDPVLVRVGFVVLGVWPFPGFGVLLYVALAFVLPAEDDAAARARQPGPERDRGVGFYVGVALLVVAALALLGGFGAFAAAATGQQQRGLLPLVLIGVGVALWVSDRGSATTPGGPGDGPGGGPAASAPPGSWERAAADTVGATTSATTPPSVPPVPPAPPAGAEGPGAAPPVWEPQPPRPRSPLGRVTLGLALAMSAGIWALQVLGIVAVSATTILAVALGVLGAGLLVGSVAGRARWLAWIAAPLALLLVLIAVVEDLDLPLQAGVADRTVRVVEPPADDVVVGRLGAGRLELDLTDLAGDADGLVVDAVIGAGELEVVVPSDVRLVGRARVEVGELEIRDDGRWRGRGGLTLDEAVDIGPEGAPVLDVDLRVGAGRLSVRTVPATTIEEPSR